MFEAKQVASTMIAPRSSTVASVSRNTELDVGIRVRKNPKIARWGRVGETGQSAEKLLTTSVDEAIKMFTKTFQSKHGYKWDARNDGNPPKAGKVSDT